MTDTTPLLLTDGELDALHRRLEPFAGADMPDTDLPIHEFRTAFMSDLHLGRPDSKTDKQSIFLDRARLSNKIIINGDFIDYWLFRASRPQHLGRIFKDDTHMRTAVKFLKLAAHVGFRLVKWEVFKPSGDETMRWEQSHNIPLQKLLRILRKVPGIFVPGNHDEIFRGFTNELHLMGWDVAALATAKNGAPIDSKLRNAYFKSPSLGNMDVLEEFVYETMSGEHMHVCHGDKFDNPMKKSSALGMMATCVYHNGIAPLVRNLGFPETASSMTDYVNSMDGKKDMTKYYDRYAEFLGNQNAAIVEHNRAHPDQKPRPLLRGGIHGHIHNPGIFHHRGYVFIDSGDWVDDAHCTAAVEHRDGSWQIMTVNREKGIHPHPVTPERVQLFQNRSALSPIPKQRPPRPDVGWMTPGATMEARL